MLDEAGARSLWRSYETLHAVTYFADESRQAAADAGCRGFWMGYFGFRAAPLGPVGSGVVSATFANFAPGMVERSVPDVWAFAAPEHLLEARRSSAAAALRRASTLVERVAGEITPPIQAVLAAADRTGRPLFAANDGVSRSLDPVETLWQLCTSLREHRGDGHVAALASAGLSGLDGHLLQAGSGAVSAEELRVARGWTDGEWQQALDALVGRGLLAEDGSLTEQGTAHKREVEATTDRLAATPWAVLRGEVEAVAKGLRAVADEVRATGVIPFPNPMGLDRSS